MLGLLKPKEQKILLPGERKEKIKEANHAQPQNVLCLPTAILRSDITRAANKKEKEVSLACSSYSGGGKRICPPKKRKKKSLEKASQCHVR